MIAALEKAPGQRVTPRTITGQVKEGGEAHAGFAYHRAWRAVCSGYAAARVQSP